MEVYNMIQNGDIKSLESEAPENTIALREFHNWIKLSLIFESKRLSNGNKLLDVAVGRGGDIAKWSKAKFRYVTGIDSDRKAIFEKYDFDGAIKRFQNISKNIILVPKCYFWHLSASDPNILNLLNGKDRGAIYDVVSCQFAFHYFVKEIDIVLNMVSNKLRKGGVFIGTASDGDLINKNINTGNVKLPMLNINKVNEETYEYEMKTGKTSRETYFEYRGALMENFLYKQHLIEKCEYYGLQLVRILNFHEWNLNYKGKELSKQEQAASFMNFSFVFVKS